MKINIVFEKNTDVDAPCWAKTEVMGQTLHALGKTWDEAKARLTAKVTAWLNASVPPSETVEVESKDEEMDTELFPWEQRTIEAGKV